MQINEPASTAAAKTPRHATKPVDPNATAYADRVELGRSTAATAGNRAVPLIGGDQIFPAAEAAIRGAKGSIQLEMYRLGYDNMINALIDQAKKGVHCQVLLDPTPGYDAQDTKSQDQIKAQLRAAGVEILTYPIKSKDMIDHVKLLVIDGTKALIGGMNWDKHSPKNMDGDLMIEGPAVHGMADLFNDDWQFAGGKAPSKAPNEPLSTPPTDGDATVRLLTTDPSQKLTDIRTAVLNDINGAKKSVHMMAFVLADKDTTEALIQAKKRGLDVKVLLDPNKPTNFPNLKTEKILQAAGVEVRWLDVNLDTEEKLHAKLAVIDGDTTMIGSANFTHKGLDVNHEADVEVKSKSVGNAFETFFQKQWDSRAVEKQPQVPDWTEKASQAPVPEQTAKALFRYFGDNYHPDAKHNFVGQRRDVVMKALATSGQTMPDKEKSALAAFLAKGPNGSGDEAKDFESVGGFIGHLAGFISNSGLYEVHPAPGDTTPLWKARLQIAGDVGSHVSEHVPEYTAAMLDAISDPGIKAFVKTALEKAPRGFYEAPSSSTGKFHPADEVNPADVNPLEIKNRNDNKDQARPADTYHGGGLVLHSARTVEAGRKLTDFLGIQGRERDLVLAGLALHDIMKFVTVDDVKNTAPGKEIPWGKYTTPDHGPAGALWLHSLDPGNAEMAKTISHYVEYHMAHWNHPDSTPPSAPGELVVSLSDYLASQPNFYVKVPADK